jgi:ribosomal protein S18 acetylase RimI-like enzyme
MLSEVLLTSGVFGLSDAECVDEMFAETWMRPRPDAYQWVVAADVAMQRVQGFACFGQESLTRSTWDLFWICLRSEARGHGIGRMLITEAVQRATIAGGTVMVIYTSSNAAYEPARRLYGAAGFVAASQVPDYYAEGDNLLIYWRRLCPNPA